MFKKLKKIDKKIKAKKVELQNVKSTNYFDVFFQKSMREHKRQIEINRINSELKQLLSRKHSALETLQQNIELLKVDLSVFEKQINLESYASA